MQFVVILALALKRDLSEILNMPALHFNVFRAYYGLAPFGDVRGDAQAGIVASTIANVNRGRGVKPFSPSDFMIDLNKKNSTPDEVIKKRIEKFMMRYR